MAKRKLSETTDYAFVALAASIRQLPAEIRLLILSYYPLDEFWVWARLCYNLPTPRTANSWWNTGEIRTLSRTPGGLVQRTEFNPDQSGLKFFNAYDIRLRKIFNHWELIMAGAEPSPILQQVRSETWNLFNNPTESTRVEQLELHGAAGNEFQHEIEYAYHQYTRTVTLMDVKTHLFGVSLHAVLDISDHTEDNEDVYWGDGLPIELDAKTDEISDRNSVLVFSRERKTTLALGHKYNGPLAIRGLPNMHLIGPAGIVLTPVSWNFWVHPLLYHTRKRQKGYEEGLIIGDLSNQKNTLAIHGRTKIACGATSLSLHRALGNKLTRYGWFESDLSGVTLTAANFYFSHRLQVSFQWGIVPSIREGEERYGTGEFRFSIPLALPYIRRNTFSKKLEINYYDICDGLACSGVDIGKDTGTNVLDARAQDVCYI